VSIAVGVFDAIRILILECFLIRQVGLNFNFLFWALSFFLIYTFGRSIPQAVSRWLPTAAARVQTWVYSCGICGGQSGAGAGFLQVLRFYLPIFIPPISPQSPSPIIWDWYNRPVLAAVLKVPPH
jgi:hypothetical protein